MSKTDGTGEPVILEKGFKGWKAILLQCYGRPKGAKQLVYFLWGWDIFFNKIPFIKTLIAANIIMWLIFAWIKQ